MSERRSGRVSKKVDYAMFGADNDDDFADPTPPSSKRQKKADKPEKERDRRKPAKAISPDKPSAKKQRIPLDEKLYERDLQAAMEMSLKASQSQQSSGEDSSSSAENSDAVLHSTPLSPALSANRTELPEESQSIMPSAIPHSVAANDEIEFLETVTCNRADSPKPQRRTAVRKKPVYVPDEDEDEESTDSEDVSDGTRSSDSDSDFDDADSDFDDSKVKGKGKQKAGAKVKKAPVKKKEAAGTKKRNPAEPKNKTKVVPKPVDCSSVVPKPVASSARPSSLAKNPPSACERISSPSAITPAAAVSRAPSVSQKPPVWTPPGQNDGRQSIISSVKSPSSGLRLGLSRHARLKPLHPSLKVAVS